jgi:hypothetical protein
MPGALGPLFLSLLFFPLLLFLLFLLLFLLVFLCPLLSPFSYPSVCKPSWEGEHWHKSALRSPRTLGRVLTGLTALPLPPGIMMAGLLPLRGSSLVLEEGHKTEFSREDIRPL